MAVYRSRDLKQLDTSVHLGFGDLVVAGEYNCTGHLGTVWLQLPVDRCGQLGSDMYPMFDYVWSGDCSTIQSSSPPVFTRRNHLPVQELLIQF